MNWLRGFLPERPPTLLDVVVLTIVSDGLWIAAAIEWPLEQR